MVVVSWGDYASGGGVMTIISIPSLLSHVPTPPMSPRLEMSRVFSLPRSGLSVSDVTSARADLQPRTGATTTSSEGHRRAQARHGRSHPSTGLFSTLGDIMMRMWEREHIIFYSYFIKTLHEHEHRCRVKKTLIICPTYLTRMSCANV